MSLSPLLVAFLVAVPLGSAAGFRSDSTGGEVRVDPQAVILRTPIPPVAATSLDVNLTVDPEVAETGFIVSAHCNVTGGVPPWTASLTLGEGIYANVTYSDTPLLSFGMTHIFDWAGLYTASCAAKDGAQTVGFASLTVIVFSAPVVTLVGSASTILEGASLTLTATSGGGVGPIVYRWMDLPPGCDPTDGPSLTCTPKASGTWTVTVAVEDSLGGRDADTFTVTVQPGLLGVSLSALMISTAVLVVGVLVLWFLRRRRRYTEAPEPPVNHPDEES